MNATISMANKLRGTVTMANQKINGGASPYPKTVGPAAIASFSDGAQDAPLKSLTFNIEPAQDLHGYDSPWPAGGGKNILPPMAGGTANGVTITVADDGTITINGTATVDTYFDCNFEATAQAGETIYFCAFNPTASNSRLSLFLITPGGNPQVNLDSANAVYSTVSSGVDFTRWRLRVPAGTAYTNYILKPMLQIGGTAPTAYSPYSNVCPISGWTQVNVVAAGKNLADITFERHNVTQIKSSLFGLKAGSYKLSFSFLGGAPAGVYLREGQQFSTSIALAYGATELAFSLTKDYSNLCVTMYNPEIVPTDVSDFQIEVGSTATSYAAPIITPITISLGRTVYGGMLDVVRGKLNAKPYYASYSGQSLVGPWISSHDKYVAGATPTTGAQVVDMGAAGTEYDVTPQTIKTLLGVNNIWADSGDTTLEYYPAAASIVSVLNRSSKVYTSIPLGKIRYETYQITPQQTIDLDSYRSENGNLLRNPVATKCKLEFNTPLMTDTQWAGIWNIIKAGFNNNTERKLKLKYYDTLSASYKTGYFYVPDVQTTIRNIEETEGVINYNEIRLAFIEY